MIPAGRFVKEGDFLTRRCICLFVILGFLAMQSGTGTVSDLFSGYEQHPPPPGSRLAQYLHGSGTQQVPRPSAWTASSERFANFV